jgi:hypothetical protein
VAAALRAGENLSAVVFVQDHSSGKVLGATELGLSK